jgi:hypothetical protein
MTRIAVHGIQANRLAGSPVAGRTVAVLACVALAVGVAASASAATTSPRLSAIFDSANDSQDVYFEAPSTSLREVAWTPATGFRHSVSVIGSRSLASAPGATFDSINDSQDVYFEAPNGSLHEVAWTPATGFRREVAVTGAGSLASAPSATFDSANDSQDVYFEAPNGSLHEVAWTPTTGFRRSVAVTAPGTLALPSSPAPPARGSTTLEPPTPPAHPHHRARRRRLRVKITLHWRWSGRHTRLVAVTFGRLPRGAEFEISCRGRRCPSRAMSARAHRFSRRLLTHGDIVYTAGDRLIVVLRAPNYKAERAAVRIRRGRIPAARLLS